MKNSSKQFKIPYTTVKWWTCSKHTCQTCNKIFTSRPQLLDHVEWKYPIEFEVYVEDFGNDDLFGSTEISLDEVCDNSKQTSWITFKGGKPDPYAIILYNKKN